jgi:hypothetical protein
MPERGDFIPRSIAISATLDRDVSEARNLKRFAKRYKAAMKQVVGGLFSGLFDRKLEEQIVGELIDESQRRIEEGFSVQEQKRIENAAADRITVLLKELTSRHVDLYLESLCARLLDSTVQLRWDRKTNNCQNFCDAMIDQKLLGPLIATKKLGKTPLYAMSFVCRPGSYSSERVDTKYQVPNGQTEECKPLPYHIQKTCQY